MLQKIKDGFGLGIGISLGMGLVSAVMNLVAFAVMVLLGRIGG